MIRRATLPLRKAKHAGFLGITWAGRVPDAARRARSALTTYTYDSERYRIADQGLGTFRPESTTFAVNHVAHPGADIPPPTEPIPHRLWCVWAGPNPLPTPRKRALEALRANNPTLDVVLVTPDNLSDYLVPGEPLHQAYEDLSYVHRSDYLRAYLMHHHGGAYSDIKDLPLDWSGLIDRANRDSSVWACGPHEPTSANLDAALGNLGKDQRTHFRRVLFQAAFAFRPRSPWTAAWLREVERRLSYFQDLLRGHPAEQPFGLNEDYPVPWYCLNAQAFSPLALRYHRHALLVAGVNFRYTPEGHR